MDEVVNALKAQGLVSGAQKALLARVATQNPAPRPPASQSSPSGNETIPDHARSACEQHRFWIEEQVRLGRNAVSIYQDLVEQYAFEHKYNSVKRFCRALRKKDPRQYDRLEFGLGEEVTVWKDTTHGRTYAPVVVSPFLFLLFIEDFYSIKIIFNGKD